MVYAGCVLSFSSLAHVGEVSSTRRSGVGISYFGASNAENAGSHVSLGRTQWYGRGGYEDYVRDMGSYWHRR